MVALSVRVLRRCVTSLLLALFCLPVAVLIFDTLPQRHAVHHTQINKSTSLPTTPNVISPQRIQDNEVSNRSINAHPDILLSNPKLQVTEAKNTTWYSERVMEARMAWRRRTLKEACSRFGLDIPGNDSLHRPNAWEFLINKQYHLIWCNVFKAASSSWMYNFNILAGYKPQFLKNNNLVPLQLARKKYIRPSVEELNVALNDSIAFLIVRHPLERLLSAYRDKIQYALPNTHHSKLGQRIIIQFRNKIDKEGRPLRDRSTHSPRWPTFSEFVNYLIHEHNRGHSLDMHWTPIAEFCSPCQVEFDLILKFDTLDEDQRYLIEMTGIGHLVKAEWRNPSKGPNTPDVITKYYNQLTLTQLLQLYNIYRFDFELFGYTLDRYLELATNDTPTKAILV